jgi:parallel beta-helix repeat protein
MRNILHLPTSGKYTIIYVATILLLIGLPLLIINANRESTLLGYAAGSTAVEAEEGTLAGCVNKVADGIASGGYYVQLGCNTGTNDSPLGLDSTGKTIPDTNYPVPAGAIFMATNGNDANPGTEAAPVKTINRAMSLVAANGTIVIRSGVYRDWYNSGGTTYAISGKGVTVQNYPHEQVWFDGTDVVSAWVDNGDGKWYKDWNTPQLCDSKYYQLPPTQQNTNNSGPCSHKDMSASPSSPVAGDPQNVFINGVRLKQVASLGATGVDSFYYDWAAKRMYILTDPNGKTIEMSARPVAIVFGGSNTNGNTIRGIGIRRYATNEMGGITSSAVYMGGAGPNKAEKLVFMENSSGALSMSNPLPGSYIKSSVFAFNGYTAAGANGGSSSNTRNDFLMEGNVFNSNNTELFGESCNISCGQANVKLGHMVGFTLRNNIVENGMGDASGLWCDLDCRDGVFVNNVVRNNGGSGIFYEVSSGGIIASNLVVGGKQPGINVASSTTKVYNNTVVNNQFGIQVYDDGRAPGYQGWTDIGPNTSNVEVVNNVIYDEPYYLFKTSEANRDIAVNTKPSQFYTQFDYNAYYRVNGQTQNLYNWNENGVAEYFKSSAAFAAAKGWDSHAIDVTSGGDPFFTNLAGGDYTIRSSSPAYNSGKPLPADVASKLGIINGQPISRGAITWPGKL